MAALNAEPEKADFPDLSGNNSNDEVENAGTRVIVDKMTERKLMTKIDKRIIPMVMWMSVNTYRNLT